MSLLAEFTQSLHEHEQEIVEEANKRDNFQIEDVNLAKPTKAITGEVNKWVIIDSITANYLTQLVEAQI